MTARFFSGLTLLVLAGSVLAGAWWLRAGLHDWTRDRAALRLAGQVAKLPERPAVRLLKQLAEADDEWLAAIVPALSDSRPRVAMAAAQALEQAADRWATLPSAESSPQVEWLAALLALHAPSLPAERVTRAQALAQRLIDWPLDPARVDAARFLANCEVVLRLEPAESSEIRIASARPRQ